MIHHRPTHENSLTIDVRTTIKLMFFLSVSAQCSCMCTCHVAIAMQLLVCKHVAAEVGHRADNAKATLVGLQC